VIRTPTAALVLTAACGLAAAARPQPASIARPRPADLDLIILGEDRLARLELRVEVGGRQVSAVWDETFDKLFAYHDRNGDGAIDGKEVARLPSPFALRQLLWGQSVPYSGPAVALKAVDRDGDGRVTRAELVDFYRRSGLGRVSVGVGRPHATDALTRALLKALGAEPDGTVTESRWRAAAETLRTLDRNDDELIGPGELVPRTAYPGTLGAILLAPPAAKDVPVPELAGLPVIILPADPADTSWAAAVVARRDRDKDGRLDAGEAGLSADVFAGLDADRDQKLSPAELAAWRTAGPTARATVRLGKRSANQSAVDSPLSAVGGRLRLDVRADEGKMPQQVAAARKQFLDRFTDVDADADGFIEDKEITKRNQSELKLLLPAADRDGDGKLSRAELVAWLDIQDQVATGHALLTILDHGAGLFELLDADHDGSLSVPELRRAWERVTAAGCVSPAGKFDAARLPRQLLLTASRGHPVNPLGAARRDGPAWFRAMDRNGDGYVSRREFTGPADVFNRLDLDRDGLLSPEEAGRADGAR
jgi:Ca2+-binding EF-hand superfamily protein